MLDKKVFTDGIEKLTMAYPNWSVKVDDLKTMQFWYSLFEKKTNAEFNYIINKHINEIQYNPTVASLNSCFKRMSESTKGPKVLDWDLVMED